MRCFLEGMKCFLEGVRFGGLKIYLIYDRIKVVPVGNHFFGTIFIKFIKIQNKTGLIDFILFVVVVRLCESRIRISSIISILNLMNIFVYLLPYLLTYNRLYDLLKTCFILSEKLTFVKRNIYLQTQLRLFES